jgi:hypothetical protein
LQARAIYRGRTPKNASAAPRPKLTRLTARVRQLYEDSAVPVREIASLAGVSERTIYKYAARHGWKPRYAWARDRGWRAPPKFAAVKGAGGRFIRRDDKGKPYRQGLKATDRHGERRAAARCRQVAALARAARAEAEAQRRFAQRLRAIEATNRALEELNAYRQRRAKERRGRRAAHDGRVERAYMLSVQVAAARWWALLAREGAALPQQ